MTISIKPIEYVYSLLPNTVKWKDHQIKSGAIQSIEQLLSYVGEDPNRPGLKDTPKRIVESYHELFSGYVWDDESIKDMMTVFDGEPCNEMVLLKGIEFTSFCEHHWLPFEGVAHVAYIPDGNRVVGISKLARLLEVYSRRLQIQERIGRQITAALMEHLQPQGAACVIEARHLCMTCRGVRKQNSVMITADLQGTLKEGIVRQEFYSLIGKQ